MVNSGRAQPLPHIAARMSALSLAALLAAATCACGTTPHATASSRPGTPTTSTSNSSTPAPSPSDSPTGIYPSISAPADGIAGFTAAEVQAAYLAAGTFTLAVGWQPDLIHATSIDASAPGFAPLAAMMTPTCAADFEQILTRAAAGTQTDKNTIEGITLVNVDDLGSSTPAPGTAVVTGRKVTTASAAPDASDPSRLAITLTATAEFHFTNGATKSQSLTTRHITYDMVPGSGTTPWLIDAWNGTVDSTAAQPEQ